MSREDRRERSCYIAFVDDPSQGLENYEYQVEGDSEEDARLNAQDQFPYGMIRGVVRRSELDGADALKAQMEKRRAEESKRTPAWPGDLFQKWPGV